MEEMNMFEPQKLTLNDIDKILKDGNVSSYQIALERENIEKFVSTKYESLGFLEVSFICYVSFQKGELSLYDYTNSLNSLYANYIRYSDDKMKHAFFNDMREVFTTDLGINHFALLSFFNNNTLSYLDYYCDFLRSNVITFNSYCSILEAWFYKENSENHMSLLCFQLNITNSLDKKLYNIFKQKAKYFYSESTNLEKELEDLKFMNEDFLKRYLRVFDWEEVLARFKRIDEMLSE